MGTVNAYYRGEIMAFVAEPRLDVKRCAKTRSHCTIRIRTPRLISHVYLARVFFFCLGGDLLFISFPR